MADGDTTPAAPAALDPDTLKQLMQLQQQLAAAPLAPTQQASGPPVDRSFASLLGETLGGGTQPGILTPEQQEGAGRSALMQFGINMLAGSGYQPTRRTFGQILAEGLGGAGESLTSSQSTNVALQKQQQQMQIERLKAMEPLLTTAMALQKMKNFDLAMRGTGTAVANAPPGGTPGGPGGNLAPFVAKNLPEGVSTAEDQMVRTVLGEAANQGLTGQQAVASVIKNRMASSGQSAQDVIFAKNQFEPWNTARRSELEGYDPNSKLYQDVLNNVVRPIMSGDVKDPTGGATHFYAPQLMKDRGQPE